ncbi:SsrA-binding protein SmpB [Acetobacterium carbinolicum]|jgi:SsrA-binding protein|uniref:SsrA-binding protein SmpB n=1 Tax=Acetobacterium TaxID=33951 RepID=UPI000DBEC2A8|nr:MULTISPECIES: SsrA-binding protein SmpB [unclassified Acetobacterium]AWW25982.1 SsrA-binding protein [Acetobacterium sp. KB-1]MDK2941395.1 SsrA-binding protein [Acetobacterium sp.]MDZ5723486.1 SsrA-binding protein SmpB [Acetobacterium sp. K1/6]
MGENIKIVAKNRKARHDFAIEDTYEVGLVLAGTEVKSIRGGKVSLKESFADIYNGEIFVYQMHIDPYEQGNIYNKDPLRIRKLLMHKQQIRKLVGLKQREGYTLVPLTLYFKDGRVKMELALAKGKKLYDKRHAIAERDSDRRIQKSMRHNG